MRLRVLTFIFILSLLSSISFAENWEPAGESASLKSYTDTDAIVLVALPDGTIVPNIYTLRDRAVLTSGVILEVSTLIDLQNGKIFVRNTDGSKNLSSEMVTAISSQMNYWKSVEVRSSITYFSYLYQNKGKVDSRPPYKLTEAQSDFGDRFSESTINSNNWKKAYQIEGQKISGKIYTPSIQLHSNGKDKYPSIRFLAIISYPSVSSTKESVILENLVLCEINPNLPQQHLLTYVGFKTPDFNGWKTIGALQKPTYHPFAGDSPAAFLGSAALEYLILHKNDLVTPDQFIPEKNEKSPDEWIRSAGLKRYQE